MGKVVVVMKMFELGEKRSWVLRKDSRIVGLG